MKLIQLELYLTGHEVLVLAGVYLTRLRDIGLPKSEKRGN